MKKDIHPKCYQNVNVKCVCGAIFSVVSTKENLETEVCSNCHPFYTGKNVVIDVMGKIEKFKKKMGKKQEPKVKKKKISKIEKREEQK